MDLRARTPMREVAVDTVFVGSCTQRRSKEPRAAAAALRVVAVDTVFVGSCPNGSIEDMRAAAAVLRGRTVADGVTMLVVPGSMRVRAQAEEEGLDTVFTRAGAQWRAAGCSMCLG